MAWHRIGDSFYSDKEINARNSHVMQLLLDIGLPSLATYWAVNFVVWLIGSSVFFMAHTTTAKLIYIFTGIFVFLATYALRYIIFSIIFIGVVGCLVLAALVGFYQWLAS